MKMFNKIVGCSTVAAALAISASTTQAQNLLVNPGFDTSPAGFTANPITLATVNQGWATFGISGQSDMSSSPDSPLSGSYALLEGNAAGNNYNPAGAYQIISGITAGSTYTLSGSYLADTALTGTFTTPVCFQLTFQDAALNNLGTVETGAGKNAGGFTLGVTSLDTWLQGSISATAPAGTVYAEVYAMFMDNGQTATDNIYFDNLSLVPTPEPSTIALAGLGGISALSLIRRRKN